MELAFATKSLRQVCESEIKAKRALGPKIAEKLKRRLADLRAAVSTSDVIAGQPRELDGTGQGRMAINLSDGYSVVFCSNHAEVPILKTGRVDWSKVGRIKITSIGKIDG